MEITEEQRERAEANRLAAIHKLNVSREKRNADPWRLFKCQKISTLKKEPAVPKQLQNHHNPSVQRFSILLEIFSSHSFSITPQPMPQYTFPGRAECLTIIDNTISSAVQIEYSKNMDGENIFLCLVKDYDTILKNLKKLSGVQLLEIPWRTLAVVKMFLKPCPANCWVACMPHHLSDDEVERLIEKLPRVLRDVLLPFQLDGVQFGLRRGGRCLLADEMGLGKTIQAIAISCCFLDEGSLLIVCPAVLRYTWAEELERWLPFCLPTEIHLVFGHKDNLTHLTKRPKVVVISYTMLRRLRKTMLEWEWALMVIDESHNVRCTKKSTESDETQTVLDMAAKVKRLIILSGTPSLTRPFDIFHQINILWPGLLGKDKYDFAKNYCAVKSIRGSKGKIFKDFSGGIRLQELNVLLNQTVMIRRLKDNVMTQLPPKRRQVIRLKLKAQDIKSAIEACKVDKPVNMVEEYDHVNILIPCSQQFDAREAFHISNACMSRLKSGRLLSLQELGVAKLSGFREWFDNHASNCKGERTTDLRDRIDLPKMVIFAHHLKVLDAVQECVLGKGISFVRIDGRTLPKDRQAAVQAFGSSPEVKVAIIGITAGGVGLNFSSAKNVVFLELPKSASEMLQAEDRAHRRGQTCSVNIYVFCAKDTLDEPHWLKLNRSLYRVSSMVNGKEAVQEIKIDGVHNLSQLINQDGLQFTSQERTNEPAAMSNVRQYQAVEVHEIKHDDSLATHTRVPYVQSLISTEIILEEWSHTGLSFLERNKICNVSQLANLENSTEQNISSQNFQYQMGEQQAKRDGLLVYKINPAVQGECSLVANDRVPDERCMTNSLTILEHSNCQHLKSEHDPDGARRCCSLNQVDLESLPLHEAVSSTHNDLMGSSDSKYSFEIDKGLNKSKLTTMDPEAGLCTERSFLRFLVSKYTGRIHLYTCVPGRDARPKPLFMNFSLDEVESGSAILLNDHPAYHRALHVFGEQWSALRSIERKKLLGKPLQLPLELELIYLIPKGNHISEGLLRGKSNRRMTPIVEVCKPLPADAAWKKITLQSGFGKRKMEYEQAWSAANEPLCKLCQAPCHGALAKTPEFFEDLFCQLSCFLEFRTRTSQRYLRMALFEIEHGVCTLCKLDCHKLVECIRPLSIQRRREYVEMEAPKVAQRWTLLERLVYDPVEGNAWHADHIIPVYLGGGECMLENMRTLCVACHAEVSAAQCTNRRLERIKARATLESVMNDIKDRSAKGNGENAQGEICSSSGDAMNDLFVDVPGSAYTASHTENSDVKCERH